MNRTTAAERRALLDAALSITILDSNGNIVNGLASTAQPFADVYGITLPRARGIIAQAARIKRGEPVKTRPGPEPMGDETGPVTVYLSADQVERARGLGNGNVSAGVRLALERA